MTDPTPSAFKELALSPAILTGLNEVGYETPTPIQAQTIPFLLDGRDVLGQAQTGTGKTAAFALPLLSKLDLKQKDPQVLVLAPTRELAIQVSEAFQSYAKHIKGFHVLPIYGGQAYDTQIRGLKRGVHVVVGTPGRVMDHMRKGTLKVDNLKVLVLDEADEMLRMGFIDDVEWVLEQAPDDRQIALFSATMPKQIRRIATKYLNNPEQVTIKQSSSTASTIRQRYWLVSRTNKLDALTRILEAEEFAAIIIFVRTKNSTEQLAEKLTARGYAASAINGDVAQAQRERLINNLKNGKLDILVATDVAARGLDVERISHVINYDIPHDTESYVHRIGRTGRAGREGDAILFVAPRERRMLGSIEKATNSKIEQMQLPSTKEINEQRISRFKQRISQSLADGDLGFYTQMIEEYISEHEVAPEKVAAALANITQGDTPFFLDTSRERSRDTWKKSDAVENRSRGRRDKNKKGRAREDFQPEKGMERFRIEVGHEHDVRPGNIVGAIANEADLDSRYIGRINIMDRHSFVDLPADMPTETFKELKNVWVSGQQLKISKADSGKNSKGGHDKPKRRSHTDARKPKRDDKRSENRKNTIASSRDKDKRKPRSENEKEANQVMAKDSKPKKPKSKDKNSKRKEKPKRSAAQKRQKKKKQAKQAKKRQAKK
ncbi:MAG: DEAD/DEAH box helicase [Gammaproteobacteria bacterium]|nr:DEAD/DEAH box helicase [Gammaproteobacteria bacterium]